MSSGIAVEVAYALPDKQLIKAFEVPPGTTARQAVELSSIADSFDGLILEGNALGIFGKVVASDYVLRAGDRVEIYRPLIADPKEVRKERAAKTRLSRAEKKA